ncbi:MAG: hypothetical protein ACRYG4_14440 [Janthinobacterium lividum]
MTDAVVTKAPAADPAEILDAKTIEDRALDYRIVPFRETDYRTGSVSSRDVEAPVINRFSDHVLVRMPDGSSLRVQEKRR